MMHRWLLRHPRFQVHFTPISGSWMNLVERVVRGAYQKQLHRGVHRSTRELETAIRRLHRDHERASAAVQADEDGRFGRSGGGYFSGTTRQVADPAPVKRSPSYT
jgi:hypothetical protein